jgi:hypothetical protein
VWSHVVVII